MAEAELPQLPFASFNKIRFPVSSVKVKGGLREKVHEYPHQAGGQPEKLGRALYLVTMEANFQTTFRAHKEFQTGEKLWPDRLNTLRAHFEGGGTYPLMIPTIGEIQAYCIDWDQEASSKILSGETATFQFREDQSELLLVDALIINNVQSIEQNVERMTATAAQKVRDELLDDADQSVFDAVADAVNIVTAAGDQADVFGTRLAAALQNVVNLCAAADESVRGLLDPRNNDLVEQLKAVWFAAAEQAENLLGKRNPVVTYRVPREMTVHEVSIAVYGDSTRALEILQMNPIEDAFAIPGGTALLVYVPDSQDQDPADTNRSAFSR